MPLERLDLRNGGVLYLDRVPGEETIALAVGFRVGSATEPPDKRGLAHLTEHMLFRSNERYTYRDIDRGFELSGGESNAYTSRDAVVLVFESLRESFTRVLDIVKWMLIGKRVDPKEFEMEKSVVLQEIAEAESNPRERIYDLVFTALYGRSDLGDPIHGYRETVEPLEPSDIVWFKECFFTGRLLVAVLSGGFSREHVEAVKALLEMFEEEPCSIRSPSRGEPRDITEESSEAKHAYVALGLEVEGSDEVLSAAKFMLGEGATSILFEKLRSEKGLVYSYGVVYDATPWTKSLAVILEGVEPSRVDEALSELWGCIEALDNGDEEYVEGRKRYFRFITRPSKISMYTRALTSVYLAMRGSPLSFEERRERLLALDWRRLKPRVLARASVVIRPGA
ncbi:peptidase M16 domain protein [Pyrolobus fumarii 1A]|uniref:Peptidase M16 domain protein n=1 Tax=Pyrolobus fumarii (strain DSM 11204 / 1A) TaxID=694429 RepID=G0ED88_PYRF1|nr:pitrilysin family protein [Pyrolobus fumarii]AEM39766.1 peptidase M16 domain protein [Pyrolobus fumarii 1A]